MRIAPVPVPKDMDWRVWRLWARGLATLQELETHWSLLDILKGNDALDVQDDIKAASEEAIVDRIKERQGK